MGKKKKKNKSRRAQVARPVATSTSNFSKDTLVSVILIAETVDDDSLYTVIKNVVDEQTHKKIDLIVSSFTSPSGVTIMVMSFLTGISVNS